MIFLLFLTTGIIFILSGYYFFSFIRWKECLKVEAIAIMGRYKLFEGLRVSSYSKGKYKHLMGVEVTAKIYLTDGCLIITSKKMYFLLCETMLPLRIECKKGTIAKVYMTTWKTIRITCYKNTFSLGNAKIELTLKAKDSEQQLAIYNDILDELNKT